MFRVPRCRVYQRVVQVLTQIDAHSMHQNLGEHPRFLREAKQQGPELVEGIPSMELKEFSVTLMDWNVYVSIDKVNECYPGFSKQRSLYAFCSLHLEMGNFQECVEEREVNNRPPSS